MKEHRLIHLRASDFGVTSRPSNRQVRQQVQKRESDRVQKIQNGQVKLSTEQSDFVQRNKRNNFDYNNATKTEQFLFDEVTRVAQGGSIKTRTKRADQYQTALNQLNEREKAARDGGGEPYNPYFFQNERNRLSREFSDMFAARDAANQSEREATATKRSNLRTVSGGTEKATKPYQINQNTRPGTTMNERSDERGDLRRTQRLGMEPTGDVPTKEYDTYTRNQGAAAAALEGGGDEFQREELAAIEPTLNAIDNVREGFKIYAQGAQNLLDERGNQIQKYKEDSIFRARQVADANIAQSKANRDLELELIEESRSRERRDEILAQDRTESDYDREEDRIIKENTETIDRLKTQLGSRYGGFGSGKGLEKIQGARNEGSRVIRELTEDRIYARREHLNRLEDIENNWKLERREIFNRHDETSTEVYTNLMSVAQGIDDNVLLEEGEQIQAGIGLLRESFDKLEELWNKTGDELTAVNQRARAARKEAQAQAYERQQSALSDIFTALDRLPSSSPLFRELEERAGLTPGSVGAMSTNEERRIAIAEGNLRISQQNLNMQIQEFERDGNQIDQGLSQDLGYLVTSTGEVFRDYFGNPVSYVNQNGSITSSPSNDSALYGSSVSSSSTVNFSRYALQLGDIVPGSPYHRGGEYDIDNQAGMPIPAWNSGTVTKVNKDPNDPYGIYVDVFDGVNTTRYAHLQEAFADVGMYINGSNSGNASTVGLMGNTGSVMGLNGQSPQEGDSETGSHLHLEVRSGQNFGSGTVVDPMSVGMMPGQMFSGKVVWVDQMRERLKGNSNAPWSAVDEEIVELAKDYFRTESGGTDWRAVELVHDYILQNKMGDYTVSVGGGLLDDFTDSQATEEYFVNAMSSRIKEKVQNDEDPTDIYNATLDAGEIVFEGKTYPIDEDLLQAIFLKAGYQYDTRFFNEMLPIE